jgi:hypothetical protein
MVDPSQGDVVFPSYTRALRVGVGGTLVVEPEWGDTTITLNNVASGEILNLSIKRVFSDTTCKNIVAFFDPPEPIVVTFAGTDVTFGDQDISFQAPRNV